MDPDDVKGNDAQDNETPEEMVNRTLAEALESQERYMRMFRNSSNMMHVLSRFMSDPIVVHDLENVCEDPPTSSGTPTESSASSSCPQSPRMSPQNQRENDMTYGTPDECITSTASLRPAHICSGLGTRRLSIYRQRCFNTPTSLPTPLDVSTMESHGDHMPRHDEGSMTCQNHEGSGDIADTQTKKDGNGRTSRNANRCNMVSTSCQTQTSTIAKTNVSVACANVPVVQPDMNRQTSSIGTSTQTSINTAMSEISKAADTIRRARCMLSSLNIGNSRMTMAREQMNNNNRKRITESDKDDETVDEAGPSGQSEGDCKEVPQEIPDPSQLSINRINSIGSNENGHIRSIVVQVRPSNVVGSGNDLDNAFGYSDLQSTGNEDSTVNTTLRNNDALVQETESLGQNGCLALEHRAPSRRRQRTTMTAGIARAFQQGVHISDTQISTDLSAVPGDMNAPARCYAFDNANIPLKLNCMLPFIRNDNPYNENIKITVEMFQSALQTAIENIEKEGFNATHETDTDPTNLNVISGCNQDDNYSESKFHRYNFILPYQNIPQMRKEFLSNHTYSASPSCSCSCDDQSYPLQQESEKSMQYRHTHEGSQTSVLTFEATGEPSVVHSSMWLPDSQEGYGESDVESTFGQCSSIHFSPVKPFNDNEEEAEVQTDDEADTLGPEDIIQEEAGQCKTIPPVTARAPRHLPILLDKSQPNTDICGGGDARCPPDTTDEGDEGCSTTKPTNSTKVSIQSVSLTKSNRKPSIFKRLTSAIRRCSFKKK